MAVLKNKTQGLYVNISKDILMDHDLSLRDRGMLATIMSLPDSWDFNVKGFAKILPDGVDCVRSSVNELMRRGYLTGGQERSEGGRFGKNVIEVHQYPSLPQLENPITANPYTEQRILDKSYADIPISGKPTQVINNKTNNKKVINHQSINHRTDWQKDGNLNLKSRKLEPMQKLMELYDYYELREILSYQHLMQECSECQLSQYELKERATEELKYLIDYDSLVCDGYRAMADSLLDYMSEVIAAGRNISFNGENYDARTMGNQFYRLDKGSIEYVIAKFDEASQESRIKNKKNYLIRMLLTAKSDLETGIKSDVNYDMAHWHERGNE